MKAKHLCWVSFLSIVVILLVEVVFTVDKNIIWWLRSRKSLRKNSMESNNVLVTGGLGTLGKVICSSLIRAGYFVIVLDVNTDVQELLVQLKYDKADRRRINIFHGDIRNQSVINMIHEKYNKLVGIIHLAGVSRADWCHDHSADCYDINVHSTQVFLQILVPLLETDTMKPWFFYLSSYLIKDTKIMLSTAGKSYLPQSSMHYIWSKIKTEKVIKVFNHTFSQTTILRIADVYGAFYDYSDRIVPYFVRQAITDNPISLSEPALVENFIHVADVIQTFVELIKTMEQYRNSRLDSLISMHLLSGERVDRKALLMMILNITNSQSLIRIVNNMNTSANEIPYYSRMTPTKVIHLARHPNIQNGLQLYVTEIKRRNLFLARDIFDAECSTKVIERVDLNNCTTIIYTDLMARTMLTCSHNNSLDITTNFTAQFRFIAAEKTNIKGMPGYYIQCLIGGSRFFGISGKRVTITDKKRPFFVSYLPDDRSIALRSIQKICHQFKANNYFASLPIHSTLS